MAAAKATKRPSRPTIDSVMDNVPPYTGVIAKGGLTNDPRPTVNGRGDAGSIIHVLVDGREVGTVVVAANGTWSFKLPLALSDNEYRLTARASNETGLSIPSTSYGIQVDTTPPSQPKIEAATEGVQPVLSGRAEAYSTVTVYDGKTLLGTAKTAMDGTWNLTLPSNMVDGKHALTVTAMDPAGNTSVASAEFAVVVKDGNVLPGDGTAPPEGGQTPQARALIDDMGKDSGELDRDWLTNNGSAGRLVNGHLSAALAVGEKVQISTDDGKTWRDAIVRPDGTWFAVDPSGHAGNWTIEARVVNAAGTSGDVSSHDVTLDTVRPNVPASIAVSEDNSRLTVDLGGTNALAGDRVHLIYGTGTVVYTLTAADVALGKVTVGVPKGVLQLSEIAVAIVDAAGNVSDYRTPGWAKTEILTENFEGQAARTIAGGQRVDFGAFSVQFQTPYNTQAAAQQGIFPAGTNYWGMSPSLSKGMTTYTYGPLSFQAYVNGGKTATSLTVDVGNVHAVQTFRFYDATGVMIYSEKIRINVAGIETYQFKMPAGLSFASFDVYGVGGDWLWFDNFVMETGKINQPSEVIVRPTEQTVTSHTDALYGDSRDNVFLVSDVSYLASVKQIAGNGGLDTLKLTGVGQFLDVTRLNSGSEDKITGIEKFDLGGGNTLRLSINDVMNLGERNLFTEDGRYQVAINGTTADVVRLQGMLGGGAGVWEKGNIVAIGVLAYQAYFNAVTGAEVLVGAGIQVIIENGPVFIGGITKDSGSSDYDFLTNDGSAGRLITGYLIEGLRSGETVQISTNRGATWQDAVVRPDGTWFAVDLNAHAGNWTIEARVVGDSGVRGDVASQPVTLDTTPPAAPTDIRFDPGNGTILVAFDAVQANAGLKLNILIGDNRFDYILTEKDVKAGHASIAVPKGIGSSNGGEVGAAFVDAAGNASQYVSHVSTTISENFSNTTDRTVYRVGQALVLDTMSVKVLQGQAFIGTYTNTPGYGDGLRLYFGYSGTAGDKLEIAPPNPSSKISFTTDYLHNPATYAFYDTAGNLLDTLNWPGQPGGYAVSYQAPPGKLIASVVAYTTEWGFLDNFVFETVITGRHDMPAEQTIGEHDAGAHYGGGADTIFNLANVAALVVNGAEIHGGSHGDVIKLTGAGQILDVTALNSGATDKITGIDCFDLTGTGANTLKLSVNDVLNLGNMDAFTRDGRVQVMVNGAAGDVVALSGLIEGGAGGWVKYGLMAIDGFAYYSYVNGTTGAEVLVQATVSVVLDSARGMASIESSMARSVVIDDDSTFALLGVDDRADTTHSNGDAQDQKLDFSRLSALADASGAVAAQTAEARGANAGMLKLSMSDVLSDGYDNLLGTDGHDRSAINDNSINPVDLSGMSSGAAGHWADQAAVATGATAYALHENTALNVELLVQSSVTAQLV